jgi:glycerophosphoryl diester phosphodiesterase
MTEQTINARRTRIKLHYFFALILLLHSFFFLAYWFSVGMFRETVDAFLGDLVGLRLPYVSIGMALTALLFLATLFRFIGLRLAVKSGEWRPATPDWIFFVAWPLFLAGFYGTFIIIFRMDPSQKGVVRHLLDLVRLVSDALLFLVAAVWLRRLILYFRGMMVSENRRWLSRVGITAALVALVGLWLVPTLFPPNWAYQGDLPTKPALIAHRGASMLSPENTLAAAELAATHQALGFETDVRISLDGVPFLMHDETLARTTNIAEVFPERVDDRASSFTLEELRTLNAGLWFIQQDPFGTIEAGKVSQTQLSINQGQGIPTLAEALDLVREQGMVILFDMRDPPSDHPYYAEFFEIVLEQLIEAQMNSNIWFLLNPQQLEIVRERAPQMTRVAGIASTAPPTAETLLAQDYEIVNVDRGITARQIRAYREEGLGVNIYTIDEPWLFSQFWLSGVTSITTNNVHTFNQLDRPVLNISYSRYVLFWGLFGIIIAIWLASSQPEPEPVAPEDVEQPDLLDFALEDGEMIVGVKNGDTGGDPHWADEPHTRFEWDSEPPEPEGFEPGDEGSSPQGEDHPPQE